MYDNYAFVLEWDDLSDAIQIDKVNLYIQHLFDNHDSLGVEGLVDSNSGELIEEALEDWLDNDDLRGCAVKTISAHFPVYF